MAVNYAQFLSGIPNPVDSVMEGVALGQAQYDRTQALEQQQRAAEEQAAIKKELLDLAQNQNPTAEDYRRFITKNPQFAKQFEGPMAQLNEEQKQNAISEATNLYAAMQSGNTEAVQAMIEENIAAARNSGDQKGVQKWTLLKETHKFNPEAARTMTGLYLSSVLGQKEFSSMYGNLEEARKNKAAEAEPKPEDVVEVADPTSPTGTRFVRKSQAPGQPGKPASGMQLTVGPDGEVQFTQGRGQADMSKGESEKLRNAEISTRNFVTTVGDAIEMLEKNPDINTFTARAAGLVNNLQQEGRAIAAALGKNFDERMLDPSIHAETFDRLGIENARMRGLITALAFQAAAASNQAGRDVTEKDIRRFIEEVGAGSSDPRAFAEALQDVAGRTVRNFQTNYEVRMGKPFSGEINVPSMKKKRYKYNQETGELE